MTTLTDALVNTTHARTSKYQTAPPIERCTSFLTLLPSFSESREAHPSWNFLRDSVDARDESLRRAYEAHHRRSRSIHN